MVTDVSKSSHCSTQWVLCCLANVLKITKAHHAHTHHACLPALSTVATGNIHIHSARGRPFPCPFHLHAIKRANINSRLCCRCVCCCLGPKTASHRMTLQFFFFPNFHLLLSRNIDLSRYSDIEHHKQKQMKPDEHIPADPRSISGRPEHF